jgi:hypothetical protein
MFDNGAVAGTADWLIKLPAPSSTFLSPYKIQTIKQQ